MTPPQRLAAGEVIGQALIESDHLPDLKTQVIGELWIRDLELTAWHVLHADRRFQPQRSSSTALLHRGGCATYPDQVGLISREDVMVALAEPGIEPCEVCRPQTGLLH
ncbi:DUF6233 domain-containing protein [[Kitasatospora] papulosa]|uniref:DUF6233 domain-containing protein n=1 Tax=[Kitasatospora] papulosa TaxID=1464011 RepID=UPI0036A74E48